MEIVITFDGTRYEIYYLENGIKSYIHYRSTSEEAIRLAKLWQEEDKDSLDNFIPN